jgi:hypothetical protein
MFWRPREKLVKIDIYYKKSCSVFNLQICIFFNLRGNTPPINWGVKDSKFLTHPLFHILTIHLLGSKIQNTEQKKLVSKQIQCLVINITWDNPIWKNYNLSNLTSSMTNWSNDINYRMT